VVAIARIKIKFNKLPIPKNLNIKNNTTAIVNKKPLMRLAKIKDAENNNEKNRIIKNKTTLNVFDGSVK